MTLRLLFVGLVAASLAACGGGGGGEATTTVKPNGWNVFAMSATPQAIGVCIPIEKFASDYNFGVAHTPEELLTNMKKTETGARLESYFNTASGKAMQEELEKVGFILSDTNSREITGLAEAIPLVTEKSIGATTLSITLYTQDWCTRVGL